MYWMGVCTCNSPLPIFGTFCDASDVISATEMTILWKKIFGLRLRKFEI